ncbi:hypothetical protein BDD43_2077 [Mucilaginibacter gracilis]|uniref:Histidine kinase n=1 Tax=Mucilaginibacter gracilis TaxID=423350 RepID=A0A495IYX7_9SPHI|nr:FIST N-terminal domain-containing protein [Mucilaginibacter gracilis]RKR81915.1 hypothetical protein BDD43_2077 [Mucilaginibacter gracilis]
MKIKQQLYKDGQFTTNQASDNLTGEGATLVLAFGEKYVLVNDDVYGVLKKDNPQADIVLCSTAGEIYDESVFDHTVSVVIIEFEKTRVKTISVDIKQMPSSFDAGQVLFDELNNVGLAYIMVISDGGLVNGSELVRGIESLNINNIPITGGLAGDADKFNYTVVGCNAIPETGKIVAIGFYGDDLQIGHGSFGGWDIFGPEKKVTRSVENRLYEIDNKSALELYKQYLGKYAEELPGSALLFPLYVRPEGGINSVVRTILSIDNDEQSMVFAGDIPQGSYIRFMKANFDKLIDAASHAAGNTLTQFPEHNEAKPKLALLISCVGRKLILGKRIEEEIEAIRETFGKSTLLTGFYSYGEISPLNSRAKCELHNQTMTITTFNED